MCQLLPLCRSIIWETEIKRTVVEDNRDINIIFKSGDAFYSLNIFTLSLNQKRHQNFGAFQGLTNIMDQLAKL